MASASLILTENEFLPRGQTKPVVIIFRGSEWRGVCREDFTLNPKKMNTIPSKPNYVRSEEMLPEISKKLGLEVQSFGSSILSFLRLYSSLCVAQHQVAKMWRSQFRPLLPLPIPSFPSCFLLSSSAHSAASLLPSLPPSILCLRR